ncbi:hypothetical protein MAR_025694, partial [Mya arenaria]
MATKKNYEFYWEVLDLVDSCDKAITLREADRAHQFIKEIKSKIENRNKIIRIADNSAAGWNTIAEYQLYDVASDSDDDKRIRKAEEKALVKMEKSRKQSASFVNNGPAGQPSSFRSFRGGRGRGSLAEGRFVQCGTVICFKCGSEGHFASDYILKADNEILAIIENGYVLPFIIKPPSFIMKNNQSALRNNEFVTSAILDLIGKKCVYEVPFIPHNVNPLSVAVNSS